MTGPLQDLRFGIRMLGKHPTATAAAVLSLALGIGANTAIFSLIDAVLMRSLPVEEPDRLMLLGPGDYRGISTSTDPETRAYSIPRFRDLAAQTDAFSGLAAFGTFESTAYLRDGGEAPRPAMTRLVSGNYFAVLGVRPFMGRFFGAEDDRTPGGHPVVVASFGFWRNRLEADPEAAGRPLILNDQEFTLLGVAPPGFFGERVGSAPELWAPLAMQHEIMRMEPLHSARDTSFLGVIGRLKPGVEPAEAQTRTNALWQRMIFGEEGGEISEERREKLERSILTLTPGRRGLSSLETFSSLLLILGGVTTLTLAIACANVANLLLARAAARRREMGVRLALGASRLRVVRLLLAEGLVLSATGGAAGLLVSFWARDLLLAAASRSAATLPLEAGLDARVLGFTAAVALSTGVLFSLAPAWRALRETAASGLRASGRGVAGAERRFGLNRSLVAAQAAFSLLLLLGAGLMLQSLHNLRDQELGYRLDSLLLAKIDVRGGGFEESELSALYDRLIASVEALPGVVSASLSRHAALSGSRVSSTIKVAGYESAPDEDMDAHNLQVSHDYFRTLGTPLLEGRGFEASDRKDGPAVAVVNRAFERRFFREGSALGGRISYGPNDSKAAEIVGVVGDMSLYAIREAPSPVFYVSTSQFPGPLSSLAVRIDGDPAAFAETLRRAIHEAEPRLPIEEVAPYAAQLENAVRDERLLTRLTASFAGLALLLAAIGLYGLTSYTVSRRTNEIGVRMALGADRGCVLGLILRESALLIGGGALVGVAAAWPGSRALQDVLFEVSPLEPAAIATALSLLAAAGLAAAYLPARRAAALSPIDALREE